MRERDYRRLVRSSAVYDLVATAGFATPWTFDILHRLLSQISPLPPFQAAHVLIANLLGSIVIVWATLRLARPEPVFGLFDSFSRGLFFIWQLYYLLVMNGAPFVWFFAAFELAFLVSQAYGYWRLVGAEPGVPPQCEDAQLTAPAT